jgi:hypothetical protein
MESGVVSILSESKDKVSLPYIRLNSENCIDINTTIASQIASYIPINYMELTPQIVTINSTNIPIKDKTLNSVCGCLVKENISPVNTYWIPFDYNNPGEYAKLLIEVIQKLQ